MSTYGGYTDGRGVTKMLRVITTAVDASVKRGKLEEGRLGIGYGYVGYIDSVFQKEVNAMWNGMDRAAVEAILGKGVVWREEYAHDVMMLTCKYIFETVTAEEQAKLDALFALHESGR